MPLCCCSIHYAMDFRVSTALLPMHVLRWLQDVLFYHIPPLHAVHTTSHTNPVQVHVTVCDVTKCLVCQSSCSTTALLLVWHMSLCVKYFCTLVSAGCVAVQRHSLLSHSYLAVWSSEARSSELPMETPPSAGCSSPCQYHKSKPTVAFLAFLNAAVLCCQDKPALPSLLLCHC